MSIIRVAERPRYTRISNQVFADSRLSFKAVGVLCQLLSYPDNWKVNPSHLSTTHKDGPTAVRSALKELKDCGYLRKYPVKDEFGRIKHWESVIFESPLDAETQNVENPHCGESISGKSISGKPGDIINTDLNQDLIDQELSLFIEQPESENGFKNFEKLALAIPSIPDPPKPGLSPPRGKGSAPVLYQAPNNSVDVNKWIQAWNQADRPGKWPAMSIGMMSSQRSLECLRQFIDHENGDEDAAIATMVKRLSNAKKDPYWKDRAVSAYILTDPNKLFLTQFDAAPVAAEEEEDFVTRMYRLYGDDQNAKP